MKELASSYLAITGANREIVLGGLFDYRNFPAQSRIKEARINCYKRISNQRGFKEPLEQLEEPGEESLAISIGCSYVEQKSYMQNCLSLKRLRWNSLHKPKMKQLLKSKMDWLQRESELGGLKFNQVLQ